MSDIATQPLPKLTLVLGGQRSGKSALAERMAMQDGKAVYLATAQALDAEMRARIDDHKARRGAGWTTYEEPLELLQTLSQIGHNQGPVLVDCLSLWVSNLLLERRDAETEIERLVSGLEALGGPIIFVSNEVGHGVVPMGELSRQFVDQSGHLHQVIAALANRVVFVTAGIPQILKDS